MAGNYMDAPGDRIAWDRDGSVSVFITANGVVAAQSATTRRILNSESDAGLGQAAISAYNCMAIVFPVPMDLVAVFLSWTDSTALVTVETSKDTTNGLDGTWDTQYLTTVNPLQSVKPNYRIASHLTSLQPNASSSDIRGVRFRINAYAQFGLTNMRAFHIYGQPSALATIDRLALWNPTLDAKLPPTWFDWGDTPRSSSADRSFRVKNLSATMTATDIDVYIEALTPGDPSIAAMHTLSENGGTTFLSSLSLPLLNPGMISDVLIVRRVVPANALVSTWSARIAADVNLWMEYTP